MSFIDDIKIKREEKKAKKLDAKLDSREKRIDARRKAGLKKGEQMQREDNIKFHERFLDSEELKDQIFNAKLSLYEVRDKLYDNMNLAVKEIEYIDSQELTPGSIERKSKLETKFKNIVYALTLVEQALEKLADIESEHEWRTLMRDLSNGYKLINGMSVGNDYVTRVMLKIRTTLFEMKNKTSPAENQRYFLKDTDKLLNNLDDSEEEKTSNFINSLVTAKVSDFSGKDKNSVLESIRNRAFIELDPMSAVQKFEKYEKSSTEEERGGEHIMDDEVIPEEVANNKESLNDLCNKI